jgi:DNA mismatch repair protein MutL
MGKIIILDENTANKIAAGEVIERPASVIKELVENSIDAAATSISVEIRNGGISFMRVIDNGSGLAPDDVEIAFERHATSKIRRVDDLESIASMGFRGEALASIAAVSNVQMSTRTKDSVQGVSIEVKGGNVIHVKPTGCPVGTSITVRELFFNTPARYKFLKKDTTEAGYIADVLSRIALGYPDISFKLVSGGAVVLHTPGNGDLKSAIFSVYGAETAKQLIEVNHTDGPARISGYIGKAELSRSNRSQQSIYINRRFIRSKTITSAIDGAYTTFLMKNRYAFAVLDIRLNPAFVDVNVHPTKMEVKFSGEQDIYRAVYHAVNGALLNRSAVRTLPGFESSDRTAFQLNPREEKKPAYTQQAFIPVPEQGRQGRPGMPSGGKLDAVSVRPPQFTDPSGFSGYSGADFEPIRRELEQKRADAVKGAEPGRGADALPDADVLQEAGAGNVSETPGAYGPYNQAAEEAGIPGRFPGADEVAATDEQAEVKPQDMQAGQNRAGQRMQDTQAGKTAVPSLFAGTRLIGQAFSTYILLEREDELFLLDQHAAHERIRYEELKEAFRKKEPLRQTLLSVLSIELTGGEYQFLMEETAFFESLGFTYEGFGTNSVILRSVPFTADSANLRNDFMEIVDFVMKESNTLKSATADEVLYQMACKSAVKANKRLDEREIEGLLSRLAELENPYTCPHGRPSILKLRRVELEKLFKRIV